MWLSINVSKAWRGASRSMARAWLCASLKTCAACAYRQRGARARAAWRQIKKLGASCGAPAALTYHMASRVNGRRSRAAPREQRRRQLRSGSCGTRKIAFRASRALAAANRRKTPRARLRWRRAAVSVQARFSRGGMGHRWHRSACRARHGAQHRAQRGKRGMALRKLLSLARVREDRVGKRASEISYRRGASKRMRNKRVILWRHRARRNQLKSSAPSVMKKRQAKASSGMNRAASCAHVWRHKHGRNNQSKKEKKVSWRKRNGSDAKRAMKAKRCAA